MGGVVVLAFAVVVAWYAPTGRAVVPVDVPPPPFPLGEFTPVVIVGVVCLGSWLTVTRLRSRDWERAGAGANLTPEGGTRFGTATLTGTVNGRPVRAFLDDQGWGTSGRYTVVQAELSGPADDGVIVSPTGDGGPEARPFQFEDDPDVSVGGLAAVGGSEAAARAVVSGRAREALRSVDRLNQVYVGDTSVAFADLERTEVISGRNLDLRKDLVKTYDDDYDHWGKWIDEGPGTVTHVVRFSLLDADELDRQVAAVAAVADAFESATGSTADGSAG